MKQLRYLIFLLFNLAYKDGKPDESNAPYFNSVIVLVAFQYVIILIAIFLLSKFIVFNTYFEGIITTERSPIIILMLLLAVVNYYFFVRRNKFDLFYNEFKYAPINTKRNRRIGYSCLVFYWVMIFVVIGNLKDWLSLL